MLYSSQAVAFFCPDTERIYNQVHAPPSVIVVEETIVADIFIVEAIPVLEIISLKSYNDGYGMVLRIDAFIGRNEITKRSCSESNTRSVENDKLNGYSAMPDETFDISKETFTKSSPDLLTLYGTIGYTMAVTVV
jgi:hypothetical protein